MIKAGNRIGTECFQQRILQIILLLAFSPVYAQLEKHELPLWQKENAGVKEIRIFRDGEQVALRQFRSDGKTAFQMVRNVNSKAEHSVHFYTADGGTDRTVMANSRSGFLVIREQKLGKTRKYFANQTLDYSSLDLDRNNFLSQVRKIRDSISLLSHTKVRHLLDETPHLIQTNHFDDAGKRVKTYNYHHGKLIGLSANTGEADDTENYTKPDGTPSGINIERKEDLVVCIRTDRTEDFFGYNNDRLLVQHTTYELGKLRYTTNNRYDAGKLIHRKFEDLHRKKVIEYSFTYDSSGKLKSILQNDGKKTMTYNYEYSYYTESR